LRSPKLALWIDLEDGAGRAAYECLAENDRIVIAINVQRMARR
jgi:hypothetical protein